MKKGGERVIHHASHKLPSSEPLETRINALHWHSKRGQGGNAGPGLLIGNRLLPLGASSAGARRAR